MSAFSPAAASSAASATNATTPSSATPAGSGSAASAAALAGELEQRLESFLDEHETIVYQPTGDSKEATYFVRIRRGPNHDGDQFA